MRLTLLIPELVWPEPGDTQTLDPLTAAVLPTLGALLARGSETRRNPADTSSDALIATAFRLADDIPYAPLRLLGDGVDPEAHCWVCADPVHLRLHQERLVLADARSIGIDDDEAASLVATLNAHFADAGEFRAAGAQRWYLRLCEATQFRVPPLSAMTGRRVEQQLPEDAATRALRRLLNEAQMLLHGHAVNEARADSGRMAINSLWLWGPGQLPRGLPKIFDAVCADHPLARGLALASGAECRPLPASYADWLALHPQGHQMVLLEDLLRAVQYEDPDAWQQGIRDLETNWFVPLAAAVRAGRVELDLQSSTIYGLLGWQVKRGDLWRFWRRPTTIGAIAARLAGTSA